MFVARQPILDRNLSLYGYELLYRDSLEMTFFGEVSSEKATASILGGIYENGVRIYTDDKSAFLNFDYDMLMSETIELLDPKYIIIELLESVEVDNELIERLKLLVSKGYRLALDDYDKDYSKDPLSAMASIVKFDILSTPLDQIKDNVRNVLLNGKIALAEKVESQDEFEKAKKYGFQLFQGYFFSRPKIIRKSDKMKSISTSFAELFEELDKEEPSYDLMSRIVEKDINLTYRLIKINSNRNENEHSSIVKNVLVKLGLKEIRRWLKILMLQDLSTDKPPELLKLSLTRMRFAELLALNSSLKKRYYELSFMGLFSTLDAFWIRLCRFP